MRRSFFSFARSSASAALVLCAACGKDEAVPGVSSTPAPSNVRVYQIDPSTMTFVDSGLVHATTKGATGSLTLDPSDLTATRGVINVDLATLSARGSSKADTNDVVSRLMRSSLETFVLDRVDEKMRWAVFRITKIEDVDPSRDARLGNALSGGEDVRRSVTLTATGTLLVHGHATLQTVKLRAVLGWAPKDDRGPPLKIAVQTILPMEIALADHEIVPRVPSGELAPDLRFVNQYFPREASVEVDLVAR